MAGEKPKAVETALTDPTAAAMRGTYSQNINTTPADGKRTVINAQSVKDQYQAILGRQPTQAEINSVLSNTRYVDQLQYNLNQIKTQQSATETPTTPTTNAGSTDLTGVVAGNPSTPGQMNIADWASQVALDPSLQYSGNKTLTNQLANTQMGQAAQVNANDPKYNQSNISAGGAKTATAAQATAGQGTATGASQVAPKAAQQVDAYTAADQVENAAMQAAKGEIRPEDLVTAPEYDLEGLYSGTNADGSTNWAGKALNEYQSQNMTNVIDTSTAEGKAIAEQLGEFNYLDSKATLQGQLELLQSQFVGPNGEPKIPSWAAATARSVGRIAAFNGMTGTAATAAMSQALLEASIPIAQADAQFFQTLTLQNLTNKQASTINKANVLAKFELTNLDNRMTAAVENAKAFLTMDLANLSNEQQARMVNTQARVQAILEDAKAINTARMFNASEANDNAQFYDQLNANISMFNAEQMNSMSQFNASQQTQTSIANAQMKTETSMFNASQLNQMAQFNANLAVQQDQFYKTMQYNIDVANANWRNQITMQDNQFKFEAAATDVKNMFDLSQEQLNRIWDRSDQLLDYLWTSSENQANRDHDLARIKLQGDIQADAADSAGWGSVWGTIIGDAAEGLFSGLW